MAEDRQHLALQALDWARARAQEAQVYAEPARFYMAVGESLYWITMLNDALYKSKEWKGLYECARDEHRKGALIPGLHYARNRQVHDFGLAGMQGNPLLAQNEDWVWRAIDDPAIPTDYKVGGLWGKQCEDIYRKLLAGQLILPSIESASAFLTDWSAKREAGSAP